ncbi:hypothetical protein CEUSTIGMA_g1946.t1 [Chlamydomonas eustigma]|uniref:Large ribosomal subunit protein uL24 C-terminal domain-containing protein n=1 Tax=Chlamydomonas eustigma TaxID=1157962 RepID=A0A250WUJ6_9CHLO|nr:hypothetical protein CEUSTIGMA_g1946.t1 [Chlamydomonas eustigma]|eukprot:GAX74497.1 hypothetical protein CEUSTIGMA_g1946.t1 [Chlamydomonas eustigma]
MKRLIRPFLQREDWKIFVEDIVQILAGPEKGATGKVLATIQDKQNPEVIVEGVNMRKRKIMTGLKEDDFFVVSMEAPIPYYDVSILDPVTKAPVVTAFRYLPDGTKVRVGLGKGASGDIIPIPSLKEENSKIGLCGLKDTPEDEVLRVTFNESDPYPFLDIKRPSGLPMPNASDSLSITGRQDDRSSAWKAPSWMFSPSRNKQVRGNVDAGALENGQRHTSRSFCTRLTSSSNACEIYNQQL